ncbi:NUDIX domain-containing protein [uncultured Vagococcus sp.]|uniref:NUDIX domain-containing protein n=1 Tax=uncultured Vagococcus sp. TaxID=189676 RepID=UPI0028D647D0|nr:NUDIX domain-containing protein [uncultured Vagococcus sp.]
MLDIYTKSKEKTGRYFTRGDKLAQDEYQLAASVAFINKEGEYLLTKRHQTKQMGLMWELPGGAVETDESSHEAAKREIHEEIGYWIDEAMEIEATIRYDNLNLLIDVFIIHANVNLNLLILQEDEVVDVMYYSFESISKLYKQGVLTPFDWEVCKRLNEYLTS